MTATLNKPDYDFTAQRQRDGVQSLHAQVHRYLDLPIPVQINIFRVTHSCLQTPMDTTNEFPAQTCTTSDPGMSPVCILDYAIVRVYRKDPSQGHFEFLQPLSDDWEDDMSIPAWSIAKRIKTELFARRLKKP